MRVEASLNSSAVSEIIENTRIAELLGFDRITTSELSRDPFLPLAIAAEHSNELELATSVAIAFPRSPTIVAHLARDLNDMSTGRFVLGLGTQVKGHIQRRFATEWSSPGPRLRDYIAAMRSVWDAWDAESALKHEGPFYPLSLMTPEFSPGPSRFRRPPVQIAGVNKYNLGLAGEVCEGLRVHPFCTRKYLTETIWPAVRRGAQKAGRSLENFEMIGGGFIATGANEVEVSNAREQARYRIAFYGSTRTYLPVLEAHGWGNLNEILRRLVAQGQWQELAAAIPDQVLDEFCISGRYSEILPKIAERYEGRVDTIPLSTPDDPGDPDFAALLAGIKALAPAAGTATNQKLRRRTELG